MIRFFSIFLICFFGATSCYSFVLTKEQKHTIGMQIWKNEAGQKYELLVFWNKNESFPSLGICHSIWLPQQRKETDALIQTFPELINFFKQKNVTIPLWLEKVYRAGAPWKNKQEFDDPQSDVHKEELRKLLYDTIDLQIDFVIRRLHHAWKNISKKIDPHKKVSIEKNYKQLLRSPQGIYVLVDYLNFKGEGAGTESEQYAGKGWGLLQVLEKMPPLVPVGKECAVFAQAAKEVLKERVMHASADKKHEEQWLPGWYNRIDTYTVPLFK